MWPLFHSAVRSERHCVDGPKATEMPRFFFDLDDHNDSPDDEGIELPTADAARAEAVRFTGDYLRDHPEVAWDGGELRVRVRDEQGGIVFVIVTLAVGCG
jgi:hypothetical protein